MQDNFNEGIDVAKELPCFEDDSCSRYAEPEAEGVKPVLRTDVQSQSASQPCGIELSKYAKCTVMFYSQIFRISFGALVLLGGKRFSLFDDAA